MRQGTKRVLRLIFGRGQTLQEQLARLIASWVALAVSVIGVASYTITSESLYQQLDQGLVDVASHMAGPISNDVTGIGGLNSTALQAADVNVVLVGSDRTVIRVPDEDLSIEPGSPEIAIARTHLGASTRTVHVGLDRTPYRLVAVPMLTDTGSYALVLARDLTPTLTTLRWLGVSIVVLGLVLIALGAVAGYLAAGACIKPLRDLASVVARVAETDELTPMGYNSPDELGDLGRSFDTMMETLTSSRERQRRLIADAGHELRTPLTSMRTNVELLVADEKTGMLPQGARGEILGDVAAQLGEFTSLVGDLVQLSRDEPVRPSPEPLDFATVVDSAVTRVKRRGPGLRFDVELEPLYIVGEPDTLERAVTNLLDNAVKFSPEGGTIHVRLRGGNLTVSDEGPGIAEADLPHIFERFYRSNKARNSPGTGLGLSIVAHTVQNHGGSVSAGKAIGGGAEFTVTLPPAPLEALED